ncbi:MAG TPA: hypothetical protein PLP83_08005 [Candidatus Aminicenantes bacterium]|nr:hypothetical protein [Candidatus Aminicenantes bacterium]
MKKPVFMAAALTALALFVAVPVFPGTIPAALVPESARWVVHLDVEKFVATGLYGLLDKDGKFEIKSRDLNRWVKMDLLKDVKSVTVFGLGAGDDDIVFAVSGDLDKAGIVALAEAAKDSGKTAYGAYTLYSSGSDEYGAFIKDSLLVFSEGRAAIEKVLDTAGGKARDFAGTPLSASLEDVPSTAFLCGALPDLAGLGKEIDQSNVFQKARGLFFLAQEKQDTLQVRIRVTTDSPESAKSMADVVQGLIAMAKLGGAPEDMARISSLLEGVQFKVDGRVFRLDFDRPAKDVAELLSKGRGLLD